VLAAAAYIREGPLLPTQQHNSASPLYCLLEAPPPHLLHSSRRNTEMALLLALLGAVLVLVVASGLLLRWNEVRYSRRRGLPPGTMGWPLFGETTEFLKQGPSFMKARRLRLVWQTRATCLHCSVFSFQAKSRGAPALLALLFFLAFLRRPQSLKKKGS
jgi:hypothetical protein